MWLSQIEFLSSKQYTVSRYKRFKFSTFDLTQEGGRHYSEADARPHRGELPRFNAGDTIELLIELAMVSRLLLGFGVRLLKMVADFKLKLTLQPTSVGSKRRKTRQSSRRRAQACAQPPPDACHLNLHTASHPFLQIHLQQITSQPRLAPHNVRARNASSFDAFPFACLVGPMNRQHSRQISTLGRAAQLADPTLDTSHPSLYALLVGRHELVGCEFSIFRHAL